MAVWVARVWRALARGAAWLVGWLIGRLNLYPRARVRAVDGAYGAPETRWRRIAAAFPAAIAAQRGQMFVWAPVFLGLGIAGFFALAREPDRTDFALAGGALVLALAVAIRAGETLAPLLMALALALAGFLLAGARTHQVAAPVLSFRYYGPVEGRVVEIDRSVSDALRLTLDQVVLLKVDPDRTPRRVRVSIHGDAPPLAVVPGMVVGLTGHLSPPEGPVEPGGFDFQRMAWFEGIGAVGYTRTPVVLLDLPGPGEPMAALNRFRLRLSAAVRAVIPGQAGAFAAAVTTGDESALSRETLDAMRASNLAHILSISGLHMALVTGFVFVTLRTALALVPPLALRLNTKKLAALVALMAATGYLAISGMTVPTQRSYIMAVVMLVAVLLDRRALTLRAVALSALIVLTLMPEAMTGPGFQMSYAATVALVWVFGLLRDHRPGWLPRWAAGAFTLVLSSLVAGLATAPFAAAHFNQTTRYGLLANLLSAPVMGMVVMPGAVVAAVLAPLGLAPLGLVPMGWGAEVVLEIARRVAALGGAVRFVVQPPWGVLPMLVAGAIWLMLWRGRLRWGGALAVALALALWQQAGRPEVLISGDGGLVGVMTPEGRALSREKGQGFVAQSWLENDGTDRDRVAASARGAVRMAGGAMVWEDGPLRLAALFSPKPGPLTRECARSTVVVINRELPEGSPPEGFGPCLILDPAALKDSGPLAIWPGRDGLRIVSVRETAGHRLWNDRSLRETGRPGRAAEGHTEAALRAALDPEAALRAPGAGPEAEPDDSPLQPPPAMADGEGARPL